MTDILLVDDDPSILEPLASMLEAEGFNVRSFTDPEKALALLSSRNVDLCIFDIKMPKLNGYDLLTKTRAVKPNVPVIFLSSKDEEQDQIIGFTLGADDFVSKPFSKHLLLLRIRSVLRRHMPAAAPVSAPLQIEHLKIDRERHLVSCKDTNIDLTVTECLLLQNLAERPGVVKKRDQLMDAAYDGAVYVSDRTIDSHIRNIRKKIRNIDPEFDGIKTIHGLGYKLSV